MKVCNNITSRQLFLLLLLSSLMSTRGDAVENLLVNSGFEYGNTEGWTDWGCDLRAVREQVYTGSFSILASNRTQAWQGPVQSILGVMEEGKTYIISGWVRLQNADEDRIGITVSQTDSEGRQYNGIHFSTGYNDQWIQLIGQFTLNVTGNLSELNVYFEGPAAGVNFYLDDAVVEELSIEPHKPDATGQVDVDTVYQELEGFGAAGAWYEGWLTAHPKKNEIYDVLFGQLGLDIYRLRNSYQLSDDWRSIMATSAEIIQAEEASLGHPIKIMISSWSPPVYLKSNESTARGTLARHPGGGYKYSEFAKWWADSLTEYARHGIHADYVNIQNEPEFLADHDSCKFTPAETSEWAGYNLAFEAVYQELASQMTDMPKLLAPESFGCSASRAFIDELIDPSHVYGYAHHLYADGDFDNPDSFIPAMVSFSARYGDKPLFQTEYSGGSDKESISTALNLACHMHNSLVHEGVCSYFYWSAFKSDDDTELSVVIINVSDVDIDLTLSLGGFSPDSSGVYRTSETEHTEYTGTFDESQPLALRPQTITTISLAGSYSPVVSSTEEEFETGDFSKFNWTFHGDSDWFVTSDEFISGTNSAQAGSIDDNGSTTLKLTLDCISGQISFYYKVYSEQHYDYLRFYIDGTQQDQWSGNEDWTQVSFPVRAGRRTFEWTYSKDGSSSDGSDTAWIDDIVFPID